MTTLYAALDELAVICIEGADARAFLHGQLTQDIQNLPFGQACLAGYCTAKGRLLATGVIWQAGEASTWLALVRADLADALVKRLGMFVLRANVRITRSSLKVWGLGLPTQATDATDAVWQVTQHANAWRIIAPGAQVDGLERCWYVADSGQSPPGCMQSAWAGRWRVLDIQVGLPWVQAATQERFIPQTLNLDLMGGVSFSKGCYPGQEVVARSHYRGTLKRRMVAGCCTLADHAEFLSADADIFDANHPDQAWGRVVNVAFEQDTAWLLFEAQLNTLEQADLRLGHAQGAAIALYPLPYEVV